MSMELHKKYALNIFGYQRILTESVKVGNIGIGGDNPIRVQSMTTSDTMDTEKSIEESIRMIDAGCELVRLTAPSKNEAYNLKNIKDGLLAKGYDIPLVADIHFTPNAAEIAATLIEKVRVNPGNYADKKKFEEIEYTNESYNSELNRIELKFKPLINICKKHGTAMRIGTNHGSLSDRILSRYGDTPEGMVESAMEFIRICEKENYFDLIISMKASNTLVMVQAYRLLMATMLERNKIYPLHLGVTEAGDGEDGRVKSAVGIGSLLLDGIGDTVRVSLTEPAENEIPVAKDLIELCAFQKQDGLNENKINWNPFEFERLNTQKLINIGDKSLPVVVADLSHFSKIKPANLFSAGYSYSVELDKWHIKDIAADYLYLDEQEIDFEIPGTLRLIIDSNKYASIINKEKYIPLYKSYNLPNFKTECEAIFILCDKTTDFSQLEIHTNAIYIFEGQSDITYEYRLFINNLLNLKLKNPVLVKFKKDSVEYTKYQLEAASKTGALFIDGLVDGIWLTGIGQNLSNLTQLSFAILQATRQRISKTEYISCPSCGRTLFDLQETTNKIRIKTNHLKGLKIGIMGCIVNGPGEMADADYGYVGTGPGKINLYKQKTVVRKNIDEKDAVNELIQLIKENGDWVEAI